MTREEQLACLEDRPCSVCKFHTDRCNRWTCVFEDEPEEQEPCEDCISRQAVKEIINDIRDCISVEGYCAILERMKKLSPVNPQEPKHCDRNICISNEHNGISCDECEVTKSQEPCDCISRAEAIDALGYDISIESDEGLDAYRTVIKEMLCKIYDVQKENIEKLPSIQPKPKTGHSEHEYNDAYSKGFKDGKKQAFTGYCMQCYDELSPYEQAKLMVEWGSDIPNMLDKIKAESEDKE